MRADSVTRLLADEANGVTLKVKAVPGASRTAVAGMLGDRLKVALSAPPEAGKANAALCKLLAETFGLPARNVLIVAGRSRPQKTVQLCGIGATQAAERLRKIIHSG